MTFFVTLGGLEGILRTRRNPWRFEAKIEIEREILEDMPWSNMSKKANVGWRSKLDQIGSNWWEPSLFSSSRTICSLAASIHVWPHPCAPTHAGPSLEVGHKEVPNGAGPAAGNMKARFVSSKATKLLPIPRHKGMCIKVCHYKCLFCRVHYDWHWHQPN